MDKNVSRETFLTNLSEAMTAEKLASTHLFLEKMASFYNILLKWNKTHKLTANTGMQEFIEKQVVDSLLFAKLSPSPTNKKMLDFGSGGGFPGIPLALYLPTNTILLSDVIRKKTSFLSYAKAHLDAKNISVFTGDALSLSGGFDYIFLKAVSREENFIHAIAPLLSPEGSIVLYHAPAFKPSLSTHLFIKKTVTNYQQDSAISLISTLS